MTMLDELGLRKETMIGRGEQPSESYDVDGNIKYYCGLVYSTLHKVLAQSIPE